MTAQQHEQRRWQRYPSDNPVMFTANGKARKGQLRDISASGAAFSLEDSDGDDDIGLLSIDEFGEYETQIIRDMDDGFAVILSLDDEEQSALQDELSDYFDNDILGSE